MPAKAKTTNAKGNNKAKNSPKTKKSPRVAKKIERPQYLFSNKALKRLLKVSGATRITAEAVETCKGFVETMIYELAKLACASALFNKRKGLKNSDIEFACHEFGVPILAPTHDFGRLTVRQKAKNLDEAGKVIPKVARTRADGTVIKTKSTTNAKREGAFLQKNHSGKVLFSSTPFVRQISYVIQENFNNFCLTEIDGTAFKVRLSKEFKRLFQFAVETVLCRIFTASYRVCIIAKRKTVNSVILRDVALGHFKGLLV